MSPARKKVFGISGSTRPNSSNHRLLQTLSEWTGDRLEWSIYPSVAELPQFVPGYDEENLPQAVADFRRQLLAADGVVICTPEYAHGVPGALKNAIDWTVSTGDFSNRPSVLITASTEGQFGHSALLETLSVIEARNVRQLQLLIPFIRTKIDQEGRIKDPATAEALRKLMEEFISTMEL